MFMYLQRTFHKIRTHHVPLEDVVHDLMAGQPGGVHQQLERKLQPGIHLTPAGLPLAFFPAALRVG